MDPIHTLMEDDKSCIVCWKVDDFLKRYQEYRCLLSERFHCGSASFQIFISPPIGSKKREKKIPVLIRRSTNVLTPVEHLCKLTVEGSDGTTLANVEGVMKNKHSFEIQLQNISRCIHPDGSLELWCELHSIQEEIADASLPHLQNPGYRKKVVDFLCTLMLCLSSTGCSLLQNFYQLFLLLARPFKFASSHISFFFRGSDDRSQRSSSHRHQQSLVPMKNHLAMDKRTDVLARDFGKLLSSGEASDVTVQVNGQREFHVHKAILIARTPVFGSMFRHQMSETETGIVDIKDCDPDTFQRFLRFIYTGSVEDLRPEDAIELYRVADKYQVDELKSLCRECISEGLSVQSFCSTISLAVQHGENELTERAIELFIDNVDDIVSTVQWQEFLSENPIQGNELFMKALRKRNTRLEEKHDKSATNTPPTKGSKT